MPCRRWLLGSSRAMTPSSVECRPDADPMPGCIRRGARHRRIRDIDGSARPSSLRPVCPASSRRFDQARLPAPDRQASAAGRCRAGRGRPSRWTSSTAGSTSTKGQSAPRVLASRRSRCARRRLSSGPLAASSACVTAASMARTSKPDSRRCANSYLRRSRRSPESCIDCLRPRAGCFGVRLGAG